MTGEQNDLKRRRLLSVLGSGTAGALVIGTGSAAGAPSHGRGGPPGGNGGGPPGQSEDDPGSRGVGPCTCGECPEDTTCGKVEGAPEAGETYEFGSGDERYAVTIDSVTEKDGDEVTCFEFSSDDRIEKVCVKGGPDTATYDSDPEGQTLCAPTNPGGQQAAISNFSFCGAPRDTVRYFQVDLVGGGPLQELDRETDDTYNEQDRLLEAFDVSSEGNVSDPDDPSVFTYSGDQKTASVDGEDCTVSWGTFSFDGSGPTVSVDATLDSTTATSGECDVTLVAYELPDGDTEATPDNLSEQTLVDSQTETLSEGQESNFAVTLQ
ncbi:hypothetical protein [Halorientalis marina]|uniref:hypothetical protein n=1 Tax=Halorientalis marina TaxID=2931976 RepID=UPI001FF4616C|nr:hypothetical protein [Halorientalis marina]